MANDHVDFCLHKGSVHAVIGENGAGKSTLMNIICGLYRPDSGQILLNGKETVFKNPRHAIREGIGMVHQHFMLVPGFTVMENIVLGEEQTKWGVLDLKTSEKRIRELSKAFSFDIQPNLIASRLPIGLQQRVEIFKAIYRDASVLIFDEPTAVLTPRESRDLLKTMGVLKKRGVSIVFITHKLKEAMEISDRITIIRKGRIIASIPPCETDSISLSKMMIGKEINPIEKKRSASLNDVLFESDRISIMDNKGFKIVDDLSLIVKKGEVLGIAGVQGNGQTEFVEAISGLRPLNKGSFRLSGKKMPPMNPRKLIEEGVCHIPEDRLKHGLVLSYSVADNQILSTYYKFPFSRKGLLRKKEIKKNSENLISKFDIRTRGPFEAVQSLSGGNQQKVIISREFNRNITFLIANQPTRGLDVGAISYVHSKIMEVREKGAGVLFISSELDELINISDRIAVIYKGKIVGTFKKEEVTKEKLGVLMALGK